MNKQKFDKDYIVRLTKYILFLTYSLLTILAFIGVALFYISDISVWISQSNNAKRQLANSSITKITDLWIAPNESDIPNDENGELIRYGKQLIANTSEYLGPKGSVLQISNGMNCQNCHIEAGTKAFGNNYSAVASTYPKFRGRSGTEETIEKRINDCFERSLNGHALEEDSKEMLAMISYIIWLGKDVPKGETPKGAGLIELAFLDRAADPLKGKIKYEESCTVCHGTNGEGYLNESGNAWIYPPLWGEHSYNSGAGLFRISRFAGYIKANMPLGASYDQPLLSDEEAWDIAAYVNSLPHPVKDISNDWPNISMKPLDHPFGPFHDGFTDEQHKYGPFLPIDKKRKVLAKQIADK
jgi:thiosulfate dehydrogenase